MVIQENLVVVLVVLVVDKTAKGGNRQQTISDLADSATLEDNISLAFR